MLGGGHFLTHNKVLNGTYINFTSASKAQASISDRGIVAIPLELDFGIEDELFILDSTDVQKESLKYFGYDYTHEKMYKIREVFKGAKTAIFYRINKGGEKATVTHEGMSITAKHSGIAGNSIKIVISKNVDEDSKFDVLTVIQDVKVNKQTVSNIEELKENDFVKFTGSGTLTVTAGVNLLGGTNKPTVKGNYTEFLDKLEAEFCNIVVYPGNDESVKSLFVAYTKRLREEQGIKLQCVLYRKAVADHEGIISLHTAVKEEGKDESDLVYWLAGKEAGTDINKSLVNAKYDGELALDILYKQRDLVEHTKKGSIVFHKVGENIRLLNDINTFVSFSKEKTEDFRENQVIRVLDQDAIETARVFNERYLGKEQNNEAGRVNLWTDLVALGEQLQKLGAIEDFKSEDIKIEKGSDKNTVVVTKNIMPIVAMAKLYVTVIVR